MSAAYILTGYRSAVGKAQRGMFRFTRPDDLAAAVVAALLQSVPQLAPSDIDDVIVGNATPEAEQGLNIGRMIALMGLNTDKVPGVTVNRYCASGLETIAIAAAKIKAGMADCIIAGGVECMSPIPFGGWRIVPNYEVAKKHPDYYWGMGLTAEAVARDFKISREDQDVFSCRSHEKAIAAIQSGKFKDQIVPFTVQETYLDKDEKKSTRVWVADTDEGARADTSLEKLARLKPVFDANGSITAGNSSQTSDGAAFVLVVSEAMLKRLNTDPRLRFVGYAVAGVEPRIMGIGPVKAIPAVLQQCGLKQEDMDLIELNEAFAAQACAVNKALDIDPAKVNVNGGAIAIGHPIGASGCRILVTLLHEMQRTQAQKGLAALCIGGGMGVSLAIERV
jgi:acetyl-CoA acyltransferase